ncbi:hypothetical protein GCM10023168_13020 [Fodinibacter luteus]|uniref:DUF3806 domain-containing protein n=1 Tax=Fodinibacter luteus TaxID=552064 RepID=A0ABP8K9D2_9MICO
MGLLDRIRGRGVDDPGAGDPDDASDGGAFDGGAPDGVEPVEEVGVRRPSPEEEAVLDAARAEYAAHGIRPEDLASIAAAYEGALAAHDEAADASGVVAVIGAAIGDHLVATAGYRWVVSTDPFGTDLAVEPPRRGIPVVTRMLVAVRWMGRESGWVEGVTAHLARAGRG